MRKFAFQLENRKKASPQGNPADIKVKKVDAAIAVSGTVFLLSFGVVCLIIFLFVLPL